MTKGHQSLLASAVLLGLALLPRVGEKALAGAGQYLVYVGTYTREGSKGIYVFRFDSGTGKAGKVDLAAETVHPSFLALHPKGRFLYAANETGEFEGVRTGAVSAFAVDRASGRLTLLNQVSSEGHGPCHVSVDHGGRNVLVANYGGGSVAVLPISSDGRLAKATAFVQHQGSGADPRRQAGPHAHSINPSRDDRFAVAADLGLDRLLVYRFDPARGSLSPNDPPFATMRPGSGPRHFAFHPSGRWGYVINEMASTVTALAWDAAHGAFSELQTITTLPMEWSGNNTTAEVAVHPTGRFLYGSNRGHDSIAVFAIDAKAGTLTPVEHVPTQGKTPRNFGIDPAGQYLLAANQGSGSIVIFRIDQRTGRLTPTGQTVEIASPVCVKFFPPADRW